MYKSYKKINIKGRIILLKDSTPFSLYPYVIQEKYQYSFKNRGQ